ncbi:FtsK/SpoIIIE family protein [Ruminiclostridium sufflavum DSM 19573]|uniref:FtsK/SpoIIIE family protein n=1 Tax=Ruminiclostridium sufflavum DSM 19573 TaxID=1121337 RepID=A0A318XHR8_9FIRM|nr:DNA translocase FtsK [Ruminiclostridium sufflavum]PYG86564.1 FtsK/SpoIIIE family protein [Ruminiclostridium sufflavum DSM 19573]
MLNILNIDFWKNSIIVLIFILSAVVILPELKEWFINTPWDSKGSRQKNMQEENNNKAKMTFKEYVYKAVRHTVTGYLALIIIGCILFVLKNFSHGFGNAVKKGIYTIPNTRYALNISFLDYYLKFSIEWIIILATGLLAFLLFKKITGTKKGTLKVPEKHKNEEPEKNKKAICEGSLRQGCPPVSLLKQYQEQRADREKNENIKLKLKLQQCFDEYSLSFLSIIKVEAGPTITRFTVRMDTTGRLNQLFKIEREISMYLGVESISMSYSASGVIIDVPNREKTNVSFREIIEDFSEIKTENPLHIPLGKTAIGNLQTLAINELPHLLISGSTGSGKSVCINEIIISILYNASPEEVKFIFVDPKVVEMSCYNGIPHLFAPVITEPAKAAAMLEWVVQQMEERYKRLAAEGVRNIQSYNEKLKNKEKMPSIIIVIDELADLMLVAKKGKNKNENSVEESIQRLGQKARAAGIHLIVGTQRPSADVITGTIKTNIPARIAFQVADGINSRIIIDCNGAEKLLGRGDGLLLTPGSLARFQSAFISDEEIEGVVTWWKNRDKDNTVKEYLDFNRAVTDMEKEAIQDNNCFDASHTVSDTGSNLNKAQLSGSEDCYKQLKQYIAKMALSDEEEVFLPRTRSMEEELGINHRYTIESLNRLAEEGWIIKTGNGDSPRFMKYQLLLSQDDARLELGD